MPRVIFITQGQSPVCQSSRFREFAMHAHLRIASARLAWPRHRSIGVRCPCAISARHPSHSEGELWNGPNPRLSRCSL
ncbi:hypothetical protein [Lysobacter gummosus]|uniref:hypothetical protein n=1 Tax=Lysobacter gummosus TaxID=262324 RepID=UPI003635BCC0